MGLAWSDSPSRSDALANRGCAEGLAVQYYARPRMGSDEDRTLIAASQAGDRSALDRLLRQHYDRIYAICRRVAGNDADAADATQEALMAIVRGLPRFDGRSTFSTWSYRVATNACLDELRRRKRRPTPALVDDHLDWGDSDTETTTPAFDDRLVEQDAMSTALAGLPVAR